MEQAKFYLQEFIFVIFYKIHIIISIPLLVVSLTLAYVFSVKPLYITSSDILLKPFFDSRDLLAQGGFLSVSPVTQIDINTEIEILNSKELALEVGNALGIKPIQKKDSLKVRLGISSKSTPEDEIINYVTDNLAIDSVVMSSVIRVQKIGENPQDITNIVNKYIERYIEKRIHTYNPNLDKEVSFYDGHVNKKKKELEDKRAELQKFIEVNRIMHIEAQKQNNISLEKELNAELNRLENNIIEKKKSVDEIKNSEAMTKEFRESEFFSTIKSAYIPLLQKKGEISSLYNENSIEYRSITNEIDNFKKEVLNERKRIIDGFEIEIGISEMQIKNIKNKIDYLNKESLRLSLLDVQQKKYEKDIEVLTGIYDLYIKKFEEEKIKEQKKKLSSNISIISKAFPPSRPVLPKRTFMLAISILAGTLVGLVVGFAAYYFDHTIKNSNDIEKITKSPVISSLEYIPLKEK